MTINRTQDASGAWTYKDPIEHDFGLTGIVMRGLDVSIMDDFIETLPAIDRVRLLSKREEALDAFRAGNVDLMLAWLDALNETCHHQGKLPLARAAFKQLAHLRSIAQGERNTCKVPGVEPFSVVSITRQLAKQKDTIGGWVPAADLWQLLFDDLYAKGLDPEKLCDRITFYKEPAIGDDREDADRKTTMFSTFKVAISKERNKVS